MINVNFVLAACAAACDGPKMRAVSDTASQYKKYNVRAASTVR
jgi:hypothetical protein